MSYTFAKIQPKVQPNGEKPKAYWLFKPKTEEQIIEHWKKYAASTIKEGSKILANKLVKGYSGHFRNDFERAVEVYQTAMGDDLVFSMLKVENEAMSNRLRAFREGRNIYLNHSIQVAMVDSRFVDIVDTVERDVLTFPDEDKPTIDDVKILVWDGGTHYYAKIGKLDIVDEKGNQKWNTKKEAEDAAKWYIEKYW
jgi:hypothetical protein